MDDGEIREVLRDLPRFSAGERFRARVLARIRASRRRRRPARFLLPAAAAAAVVFVGLGRLAARRDEQALRDESRELGRQLDALKRSLPPSVIELGEQDGIQYALDARHAAAPRRGAL